jgi:hypothetical protein
MTSAPKIEVIRDEAALTALVPEWSELWERDPRATPFQSPAWVVPWFRHFAGHDWLVASVRRDGRLIGILPLFLVDDAHGRRLMPMGAGISDYLDGVFDSGVGCEEASFLIAALEEWQALDPPQLPPASPLLDAPAPEGWSDDRRPAEPCPVISYPWFCRAGCSRTSATTAGGWSMAVHLGAWHAFGPDAAYVVCVNTVSCEEARARTAAVPTRSSGQRSARLLARASGDRHGRGRGLEVRAAALFSGPLGSVAR